MNPISLNVIAKDNLSNIERMITSIKDFVKEIYILDTGCDEDAIEYCKQYATVVDGKDLIDPSTGYLNDFSEARNKIWEYGSQPWIMWLDTDDEFVGGEFLAEYITEESVKTNLSIDYRYSHYEGKCTQCFPDRRIMNYRAKWERPLHEYIEHPYDAVTKHPPKQLVYVKHCTNGRGSLQINSDRNLSILERLNEENKLDRSLYLYLLEEYYMRRPECYTKYVSTIRKMLDNIRKVEVFKAVNSFMEMNPAGVYKYIWNDINLLMEYRDLK